MRIIDTLRAGFLRTRGEKRGLTWPGGSESNLPLVAGTVRFGTLSPDTTGANSAVMACVNWAMRNIVEASPQVGTMLDEDFQAALNHPLPRLLRAPQVNLADPSKLDWSRMVKGTMASLMLTGNGYWEKVRGDGGFGAVRGLQFLPIGCCDPLADYGRPNVLRAYRVWSGFGGYREVMPENIVHFADGVDQANPLLGISPIKAVAREVLTDNEAAAYTHVILRNLGVPSFQISPKDPAVTLQDPVAKALADLYQTTVTGDKRGKVVVPTVAVDITKLGFSPEEMALDKMQRVPEARITAVLGIPAIVAGLTAGLERSTFANFKEAREAATEGFLVPMWQFMASVIEEQLLPDFDAGGTLRFRFDIGGVRVLQQDENELWTRAGTGFQSGIIKRSDARGMVGLESDASDEVYITDLTFGAAPADTAKAKLMAELKSESRTRASLNGHAD